MLSCSHQVPHCLPLGVPNRTSVLTHIVWSRFNIYITCKGGLVRKHRYASMLWSDQSCRNIGDSPISLACFGGKKTAGN